MRVGEVARAAGVNVQTLRFYEREGVLKPPRRLSSGYRDYAPDAVGLVRFVKRLQALGFTLAEAKEVLRLRDRRRASCDRVREASRQKVAVIDEKIRQLTDMKSALESLVASCDGSASMECPLLDALLGATT